MEDTSKGLPQFTTADFAPNDPTISSATCRLPITGDYLLTTRVAGRATGAHRAAAQALMNHYWSVSLRDYLAPNGAFADLSPRGLRLAAYWAEIVAQASNYDEPTTLRCRRRPSRRPCTGLLTIYFDIDTFDVLWVCPACADQGRIGGWEGTFWDNSDLAEQKS